jgi:integrase
MSSLASRELKRGVGGVHRLQEDELKALEQVRERYSESLYVFVSERGAKLSTDAISKIVGRAGQVAKLPLPVNPHMLRHSCGYHLAEQGMPTRDIQAYLGHKNIQHTVRYTAANPRRFDRIQW